MNLSEGFDSPEIVAVRDDVGLQQGQSTGNHSDGDSHFSSEVGRTVFAIPLSLPLASPSIIGHFIDLDKIHIWGAHAQIKKRDLGAGPGYGHGGFGIPRHSGRIRTRTPAGKDQGAARNSRCISAGAPGPESGN